MRVREKRERGETSQEGKFPSHYITMVPQVLSDRCTIQCTVIGTSINTILN